MAENWWESAPKAVKQEPANWWDAAPKANAVKAPEKDEPGLLTNLAAGAVKGASRIGATLLKPIDAAARAVGVQNEWIGRTDRNEAVDGFMAEHASPDSLAYKAGDIGTQIAGTLGVGGVVAAPIKAAAPIIARVAPGAAPVVDALASSVASGGFKAGQVAPGASMAAKAGSMGVRVAGGAVNGGASAGLVDTSDIGTGAVIGAALPPAILAAGKAAGLSMQAIRSLRAPKDANEAARLAKYLNMPQDELVAALRAPSAVDLPGYKMTVPQILQNNEASQLQRTLATTGAHAITDAEKIQQAQMREAIGRVAQPDLSVNDAANRAGHAIQSYAIPARQEMSERVRQAFDGVDPFNETQLYLPIDEMEAAAAKYLGEGTFGTGGKAYQAIDTAKRVGTQTVEPVKPMSAKGLQDLVLAVRAAGGINTTSTVGRDMAGEIRNLRESGLNNLVKPNKGLSVERMAEKMHEAGFLPDDDPATLLNLLHDSAAGSKIYAADADDAYRAASEAAQGEPPPSGTFAKTVPFQTVQNLRSSIGEAAEQARAKGANKEAAALEQMKAEIDSRINRAAGDAAEEGEYFPKDIADQYRKALNLHEMKMLKFETGPQYQMFRKGADGQPAIQGAEIPRKFYNGNASQVEDMQALRRLVGNRQDLLQEMKRFAVTEGLSTANAGGELTSKFTDWLLARSGANRGLFNAQELKTLEEVGKAVDLQLSAERLGRVKSGSDTMQKQQSLIGLGWLDNKATDAVANRIPVVRSVAGPILDVVRERAGRRQREVFARLMADPDQFATALGGATQEQQAAEALRQMIDRIGASPALQTSARSLPLLMSDQ